MRILITNDDGINSKLLKILANALKNYADEILVVSNGKIVESGSHDKLLKKRNGIYKKLYKPE